MESTMETNTPQSRISFSLASLFASLLSHGYNTHALNPVLIDE
jgi:hypothetical protein